MSSNWETVKLGDVTKFQQGKQIELEDQFLEPTNEMLRFVRIIDYTSENEPSRYIKADKKSSSYVTDEDVVMIRYGSQTAGKVVIGKAGIIANNMFRVIPTVSYLDRKYLYFYLKTPSVYSYLRGGQSSSTMPAITFGLMSSLDIKIPPLPTQKKIAHILSTLDDKIELNRKMNQTLEAMASAIFKSWFVDFDPVHAKLTCKDENDLETIAKELGMSKAILDFFPNEFEESELGMIPKGWEVSKLGNILLLLESGSRPKGGIDPTLKDGFASIGAESINGIGNFNFQSTKYITSEFFNSLKRGIVLDYDVLVYKDGAYIGKKAMFGNGFPFSNYAINEHVFILRSNDLANQFFLYFLLEQDKLALLNTNSAQPGLNQESMKNYQIILPDIKIITAFEKIVKNLVDKILVNSMEIKTLEKTRDTLLPKLLSGEIEV